MAKTFETLARAEEASSNDALWLGHARHLMGQWREASEAYQLAISIADRRYQTLLVDGDRIALLYETFSGQLRRGQFHGDEVIWSDSIPIGLPLGGSVLARDGDRVLLATGEISDVAAPVLLEARLSDLLSPVGPVESTPAQPATARQSEWGPEHHGLRTRLTLVSNRTAVGQPLLLKCELQNIGTVARTVNPKEWSGYRGFVVIGPDGKECELIAMPNSDPAAKRFDRHARRR